MFTLLHSAPRALLPFLLEWILQPMHFFFLVPDFKLPYQILSEKQMPVRSLSVRQVASTYFSFRLVPLCPPVVVSVTRAKMSGSHPPFRSSLNGRTVEVVPAIQVRVLIRPRTDPSWSPQELQTIVTQKQIMKNAASPHDIVNLLTILIPILAILRNEMSNKKLRTNEKHETYVRKVIRQHLKPALENTKRALHIFSDRLQLNAPQRVPLA